MGGWLVCAGGLPRGVQAGGRHLLQAKQKTAVTVSISVDSNGEGRAPDCLLRMHVLGGAVPSGMGKQQTERPPLPTSRHQRTVRRLLRSTHAAAHSPPAAPGVRDPGLFSAPFALITPYTLCSCRHHLRRLVLRPRV
jgi:hypothetical protein